ncbi:hypothetical protein [Orrella sp. 11846]|uniref:hypothetical protein n=1 Tax=Orrella sp. 11846 TaxID=3409913 RepID=UPI003B5ABFD5
MSWQHRWETKDPLLVLERKQRRDGLVQSMLQLEHHGEDCMARKLNVAPHITAALYQWGVWASRPQFWANLGVTPFCRLVGIGHSREAPDVRLDPQSMKIHKTFLRMRCRVTMMVLIGYYVAGHNWDSKEHVFKQFGISRRTFYEALRTGSVALYNASKL